MAEGRGLRRERPRPTWKDALIDVWHAIANDVLTAEVEGGNEDPVYTGKEVGDVVADYVETYIDKRLAPEWRGMSYNQRHAKLDEAFPHDQRYGF